MDPQVFEILQGIFPTELILIIEEFLLEAYRKDNARKCTKIVKENLTFNYNIGLQHTGRQIMVKDGLNYCFDVCPHCGELDNLVVDSDRITTTQCQCWDMPLDMNNIAITEITKRWFRVDWRVDLNERDEVYEWQHLIREVLEILFAPHKFRRSFPKWLAYSPRREYVELDGYNPIIKLAFEYFDYQHYSSKWLNEYKILKIKNKHDLKVIKRCVKNNVSLIIVPYTLKTLDDFLEILEEALTDEQVDIYCENWEEKIKECKKIWRK